MNKFYEYSFADAELENRFDKPTLYDKAQAIIDWKKIDKILKKHYKKNRNNLGNPAYPALKMFKILLVQKWEKLSDPQMEFALRDRISIIKFCDFPISSPTPDHSTICRFRNKLLELGVYEELFLEITNQLVAKGFIVKEKPVSVIDATIVKSSCRSKRKSKSIAVDRQEEETQVEEIPTSADKDARWLKKGKKSYFGYKTFLSSDKVGFIQNVLVKPANVSESKTFKEFIDKLSLPSGSLVLGDKGYASIENRNYLRERGLFDFIMHKKVRGKDLPKELKETNKLISKKRFVVEQVFGLLKRHFAYERFRYKGLDKVTMETMIVSMAYNIKKASLMLSY